MRKILKWGLRGLILLLVVAAVIGLWKREQITRLLAVNSLFKAEKIVVPYNMPFGLPSSKRP